MREAGKGISEAREMRSSQLEQPLESEALREIERSLHGRLRAHRLSDSFIERCGEEAIQRAWLDYLRARADGAEIDNPGAFVANAAFCRAIDELRHESHEAQGVGIESLLANEGFVEAPAEEVAVEHLAAQELHAAMQTLPAEERQILTLHYFEQLSDRRAAETLYCSESTFRRRRQRALKRLGLLLGLPVPEPGSDLAIEVGVAAWVCLGGARVAVSGGALGRLARLVGAPREGAVWLLERGRDLAASLTASGAGERLGALAGGPAKVLAGCAGAAAVCVVGGVIVTDAGVNGGAARHVAPRPHPRVEARAALKPRPITPAPEADVGQAPQSTESGEPTRSRPARESSAARQRRKRDAEERQVEAQTSGIARAGAEASSEPTTSAESSSSGEAVTVAPESTGTSSSSEAAREEEQVEQQFGAFK
jgi:RNA polymerase sigma factor (sigma-70 family)